MNIAPDMWPADTEALRARIARLEAQSETRRLQAEYWRSSAYHADQERRKVEKRFEQWMAEHLRRTHDAAAQEMADLLDEADVSPN